VTAICPLSKLAPLVFSSSIERGEERRGEEGRGEKREERTFVHISLLQAKSGL
jgi:hypothetical protein